MHACQVESGKFALIRNMCVKMWVQNTRCVGANVEKTCGLIWKYQDCNLFEGFLVLPQQFVEKSVARHESCMNEGLT